MSTAIRAGNGKVTVPSILTRKQSHQANEGRGSATNVSGRSTGGNFGANASADRNTATTSPPRLTCVTAYDYPTARLVDEAGVDMILVGDSLGMVVLGYENTLPVTLDEILHHTRAVHRAAPRALVIADMPYGSYHGSLDDAVRNAVRCIKEGGAEAVKIEGGERRLELIARLVEAEIPVMGHVGLTPQSLHALGGYKVQGKTEDAAEKLLRDARAAEAAGAFSIVLEAIPRELAARVTRELRIPTIGIGAGPECDGQVLVLHDMLGLTFTPPAKFVRRYADLGAQIRSAVAAYCEDVRNGTFPSDAESYHAPGLASGHAQQANAALEPARLRK